MDASSEVLALLVAVLAALVIIVLIQWVVTKRRDAARLRRELDRNMVCAHCQTRGNVTTKIVHRAQGIDGDKAALALLTGGASLLFTGLSHEEKETEARCAYCGSVWYLGALAEGWSTPLLWAVVLAVGLALAFIAAGGIRLRRACTEHTHWYCNVVLWVAHPIAHPKPAGLHSQGR